MSFFCKQNEILIIPFLKKTYYGKVNDEVCFLSIFCSIMKVIRENKTTMKIHGVRSNPGLLDLFGLVD